MCLVLVLTIVFVFAKTRTSSLTKQTQGKWSRYNNQNIILIFSLFLFQSETEFCRDPALFLEIFIYLIVSQGVQPLPVTFYLGCYVFVLQDDPGQSTLTPLCQHNRLWATSSQKPTNHHQNLVWWINCQWKLEKMWNAESQILNPFKILFSV